MNEQDAILYIATKLREIIPNNVLINGNGIYIGSTNSNFISQAHTKIHVTKIEGMRAFKVSIYSMIDINNPREIIMGEDNDNHLIILKP